MLTPSPPDPDGPSEAEEAPTSYTDNQTTLQETVRPSHSLLLRSFILCLIGLDINQNAHEILNKLLLRFAFPSNAFVALILFFLTACALWTCR